MMGWTVLILAFVMSDTPADKAEKAVEPVKPEAKAKAEAKAEDAATPEPPKSKRVLDKSYRPAVGDRAVLYNEDENGESFAVWATATPAELREYIRSRSMDDDKVSDELEKQGKVLVLDDETPVIVQGMEPIVVPVNPREFVSVTAVAIRILEGPHKGKVLLSTDDNLARFKTVVEAQGNRAKKKSRKSSAPKAAKATGRPSDPAARAASQLRLGQGLEKAGKTAGALEFYRKVVKEYPDAPQAKTAAARIAVLDGK